MPNKNQTRPEKQFTPRQLPWVLGAVMLLIYLTTLNHWVTLANLMPVAKVSGFLWQPELYNPLMFLLTSPFRLLPAAAVPLALNLFSALCAALTLVLLARSVAILPHDRTEAQRTRMRNTFSILTTSGAWFPPLLAVLMLGMVFGFWKNATSFTGESLNLLVFATIVWLLLEYRMDERPGRLTLAALIYGIGMTENWGMIGFLPVFIVAILWLRGREFFNISFLSRMVLCGLAGLLFFLVMPVVAKLSGASWSVWELLKPALHTDWQVIYAVSYGQVRHKLLLMMVTTFPPLLLMAIRWSGNFGDLSRTGRIMTGQIFYVIHAVVFGACLWIMLDPPFSPGQLATGSPALPFYYLSALAIGYYCGYFLLVFGKKIAPNKRDARPDQALPKPLEPLIPVIHWGTYAVAVIMAGTLAYKNLPLILASNDDTLARYAKLTVDSLPKDGGILLSDDEGITSTSQARALIIQAELARTGRSKDFLVVDTESLNWAQYHRFLHKKSPDKWPVIPGDKGQDMSEIKPIGILSLLNQTATSNTVCYLNPSFGYYFELFYQEPHGLVYEMKKLPTDTLIPPPLSTNLIAENQTIWQQAIEQEFPRVEKAATAYKPGNNKNPANWLIKKLRCQFDPNPNALFVASLYSRALDFWGVELQRDGQLPAAANCFSNAMEINPDNVVAGLNLDFNKVLQSGAPVTIDPARVSTDQFGKYRNWNAVMSAGGPFDDPSFLFVNSVLLARSGLMRQTIEPFNRVCQVAPDFLPARLWLAQLYLYNRLPDRTLTTLDEPLTQPKRFGLNQTNATSVNTLAAYAYFQKDETSRGVKLVEQEIALHPDDTNLLTSAAQVFFARKLYTNALQVINHALARTPDSPQWLFGKGIASLQMSNYDQAISAMTRVLDLTTNDPNARFNRALAYLKSDQLDKARADYAQLQSTYTNSFQVSYGLGEIAWRQHNTNEALRNYELFLTTAPTNSVELKTVRERIAELRKK